jgi:hypothetical protein
MEEDTLQVTENEDGSLSISWDKEDPKYTFLNDLTEEQITAILEQSIMRMVEDEQSLLDSDE